MEVVRSINDSVKLFSLSCLPLDVLEAVLDGLCGLLDAESEVVALLHPAEKDLGILLANNVIALI